MGTLPPANNFTGDVAAGDRSTELTQLAAQVDHQRTEIETLRASKARCVDIAVTQFQKGALFYTF